MKKIFRQNGFSLLELLVVTLILLGVFGAAYLILATGQSAWLNSDVQIRLQQNLREALVYMMSELRETDTAHIELFNGTGAGNTDIIRFSIPVICEAGGILLDGNGDVANWGAALTWGCTDSTCMDADNDCSTVDYMYIQYQRNGNSQLVRTILKNPGFVVFQDDFAQEITDFQAVLNGNLLTMTVATELTTDDNRTITEQVDMNVNLRN